MPATAGSETRKVGKVVWYSPGDAPATATHRAHVTMLRLNAVIDAKESVRIRQQFAWLPMALLGIV